MCLWSMGSAGWSERGGVKVAFPFFLLWNSTVSQAFTIRLRAFCLVYSSRRCCRFLLWKSRRPERRSPCHPMLKVLRKIISSRLQSHFRDENSTAHAPQRLRDAVTVPWRKRLINYFNTYRVRHPQRNNDTITASSSP